MRHFLAASQGGFQLFKHAILCVFILITLCWTPIVFANPSPCPFAELEYLQWWIQKSPLSVPLITQNNNRDSLGLIGEPGTRILLGPGSNKTAFKYPSEQGARITVGTWFEDNPCVGIELSGFELKQVSSRFSASSANGQYPVINVPFLSTERSAENVLVFKRPHTVFVQEKFKQKGAEITGLYSLDPHSFSFGDSTELTSCTLLTFTPILTFGFRHYHFKEKLILHDAIFDAFPNAVANLYDRFSTQNNMTVAFIGARLGIDYQAFFMNLGANLGVGTNRQKLNIDGELNIDDVRILQPIGLFAEPSNSGKISRQLGCFIPELKAKFGYHFSENFSAFISYQFFYISNVLRPGKQIDRRINQSQNPALGGTGLIGPPLPESKFHRSSMWIQGVSAGVRLVF